MATLKRIEKIVRQNAFSEKKERPGLKFNPGFALIGLQTTGPGCPENVQRKRSGGGVKGKKRVIKGQILLNTTFDNSYIINEQQFVLITCTSFHYLLKEL